MKPSANASARSLAATIALIGFACFVIAVVALYFLNPAYDLIRSFEGYYRLAPYEWLIASTFFALGLGSLALMLGLYQTMSRSAGSWTGLLLFGLWSLGILVAGIFPANEGGSTVPHMTTAFIAGIFPVEVEAYPETTLSFIHTLAILAALVSLSLAAILLSWRFKYEAQWRPIHYFSSILALVLLAASIFIGQSLFLFIHTELVGLSLSLLTYASLLWLALAAARLRSIVAAADRPSPV
jgi:hypothetical protein